MFSSVNKLPIGSTVSILVVVSSVVPLHVLTLVLSSSVVRLHFRSTEGFLKRKPDRNSYPATILL